jgi:hypothetical protein
MKDEYTHILAKLAQARKDANSRRIKLWLSKLHKWQTRYGAYQQVNMEVSKCRKHIDDLSQ